MLRDDTLESLRRAGLQEGDPLGLDVVACSEVMAGNSSARR